MKKWIQSQFKLHEYAIRMAGRMQMGIICTTTTLIKDHNHNNLDIFWILTSSKIIHLNFVLFDFILSFLLEQDMIITISCMEGVYYNIILSLESSGYDTITIKVKEITIKIKDLA